jgi:hypothetical protein
VGEDDVTTGSGSKSASAATGKRHRYRAKGPVPAPVAIEIVDELGLPLRGRQVKVELADGSVQTLVTDDQGKIHPRLVEGDEIKLKIEGVHEIAGSDSSVTASGQHLAAASGMGNGSGGSGAA